MEARTPLERAQNLVAQVAAFDQSEPRRRVTIRLEYVRYHLQYLGAEGRGPESGWRHLRLAESFAAEAARCCGGSRFEAVRVDLHNIFIDLAKKRLAAGFGELSRNIKAQFRTSLRDRRRALDSYNEGELGRYAREYKRRIDLLEPVLD